VGKIAEKAVCRSVYFDNMALYFECQAILPTAIVLAISTVVQFPVE